MKKTVLVDIRISPEYEKGLVNMGCRVIKIPPSPHLALPVASHPDMLLFAARGSLVCEKKYYEDNQSLIDEILGIGGFRLSVAEESLSPDYPDDVLFNAAPVGDRLICRSRSVSAAVKALYSENEIVNVNQGYAKCSCLSVGDSGIVTADPSVAKGAERAGLDVLRIKENRVSLSGYDCGFIGGASGDDGEHIFFCGDLARHPEGEKIAEFCRRHSREPISLSDEELYDYGTLIFI